MTNIEKLLAVGGNRWTKADHDRIYMSAEQLGLQNGMFNGEKISKTMARELASAKTYYDVKAERIISTSATLAAAMADILGADYSYGVNEIDVPELKEETVETELETEPETETSHEEGETMTVSEFVAELFDADRNGTGTITIKDAETDLANFAADEWEMPEDITAEEYMEAWNSLVVKHRPKNDVIRFRVTESERAAIQRLADKRTNGNISSLIKGLVWKAVTEDEEAQIEKVTRYELKTASAEIKNFDLQGHGYCTDHPDPQLIAAFRTKEEALDALRAYRCTARHYDGFYGKPYWFVTEYWVEENTYAVDEDDCLEWHDGGDIWEYAEWEKDE